MLYVLEIGSGKGGDLKKWQLQNIAFLFGCDISGESLICANERYNKERSNKFKCVYFEESGAVE